MGKVYRAAVSEPASRIPIPSTWEEELVAKLANAREKRDEALACLASLNQSYREAVAAYWQARVNASRERYTAYRRARARS